MDRSVQDIHFSVTKDSQLTDDYSLEALDLLPFENLATLKETVERELLRLGDLLQANNATMDTSLLTADQFPRTDIDIVSIRLIRKQIIALRNDRERIISALEIAIHRAFANKKKTLKGDEIAGKIKQLSLLQPFAKVTDVLPQSPALQAGLRANDYLLVFDSLNYDTTDALTGKNQKVIEIGKVAKLAENKPIKIKVLRANKEVDLTLTPNSDWNGLGLLGCKIVGL